MQEKKVDKKAIETIANDSLELRTKNVLTIKTKPTTKATKKGLILNDGYEFTSDCEYAEEIAQAIAVFAKEAFSDKNAGVAFIDLISNFYKQLK